MFHVKLWMVGVMLAGDVALGAILVHSMWTARQHKRRLEAALAARFGG